jgi:tight adherence protein B
MLQVAAASSGFLNSGLAVALISVVGGLLIGFAVLSLTAQHGDVGSRVGSFVTQTATAEQSPTSLIERALGDRSANQIQRSPFLMRLSVELDVAGIQTPVQTLLLGAILLAVLVGYVMSTSISSPVGAVFGLLVPAAAYWAVSIAADRQRRAFDEQLPDNLQVIASAMRAGQTFVGALTTVVEDAPEPSQRELRRAVTDERLGVPFGEALARVTERTHSDEFAHVALVATLQRETGGNTAEVVDLVAETIRDRLELRRMVRGLTAQGRLAGIMLSLLPVAMLGAISVIDPEYVRPLFHTTFGIVALCVSAGLVMLGGLAINKIITIKI